MRMPACTWRRRMPLVDKRHSGRPSVPYAVAVILGEIQEYRRYLFPSWASCIVAAGGRPPSGGVPHPGWGTDLLLSYVRFGRRSIGAVYLESSPFLNRCFCLRIPQHYIDEMQAPRCVADRRVWGVACAGDGRRRRGCGGRSGAIEGARSAGSGTDPLDAARPGRSGLRPRPCRRADGSGDTGRRPRPSGRGGTDRGRQADPGAGRCAARHRRIACSPRSGTARVSP